MGFPEMYDLAKKLIDGMLIVPDNEVADAVRLMVESNCVVSELHGAVSVAAALSRKADTGKIVCIIGGGSIDTYDLIEVLQGNTPKIH